DVAGEATGSHPRSRGRRPPAWPWHRPPADQSRARRLSEGRYEDRPDRDADPERGRRPPLSSPRLPGHRLAVSLRNATRSEVVSIESEAAMQPQIQYSQEN